MKKNLFDTEMNSFEVDGKQEPLKTCKPCTLEVKKISKKINNRKLSNIKDEELAHILSPFKY